MPAHGADEGLVQRVPGRFSQLPGCFAKFADEAAEFVRRRLGGNRSAERDGDRIRNTLRPFGDKPSADETEDAAPDAIQVDGYDRDIASFDDPFESASKRKEVSGAGDLAFRENADKVTGIERMTRLAQGAENHAGPAVGRNGNDLQRAHERLKNRAIDVLGIHHEPDGTIQARNQEKSVDEGDVIGD